MESLLQCTSPTAAMRTGASIPRGGAGMMLVGRSSSAMPRASQEVRRTDVAVGLGFATYRKTMPQGRARETAGRIIDVDAALAHPEPAPGVYDFYRATI